MYLDAASPPLAAACAPLARFPAGSCICCTSDAQTIGMFLVELNFFSRPNEKYDSLAAGYIAAGVMRGSGGCSDCQEPSLKTDER